MSDDIAANRTATGTTDALLRRISDLEAAVSKANGDAKKYRLKLRDEEKVHTELKTQHNALVTQHDELKNTATKSPDEWKQKHDDLQQKLRARDASDAWSKEVGESLAPKVTLEKLWSEIGYTPGEAAPTPGEIAAQVARARESVPYLFAPEKVETTTPAPGGATKVVKPPLKETDATGRGAPDTTSSRVTVRKSQIQDPKWKLDPVNSKMMADASRRGVLDIVDD
jgi:hypothetical protein